MVKVDEPPGVTLVMLNVTVAPLGSPEADRSTADLNPSIGLMVTRWVEASPCSISLEVGDMVIMKSSSGAASISRLKVVVLVNPPPDAVNVSV